MIRIKLRLTEVPWLDSWKIFLDDESGTERGKPEIYAAQPESTELNLSLPFLPSSFHLLFFQDLLGQGAFPPHSSIIRFQEHPVDGPYQQDPSTSAASMSSLPPPPPPPSSSRPGPEFQFVSTGSGAKSLKRGTACILCRSVLSYLAFWLKERGMNGTSVSELELTNFLSFLVCRKRKLVSPGEGLTWGAVC